MQDFLFTTMVDVYRHYGINVVPLWNVAEEIPQIDLFFRQKMIAGFRYEQLYTKLASLAESGVCYLHENELHFHHSFFQFPELLQQKLHCRILCLGPILFQQPSQIFLHNLMEELGIDPIFRQDITEFYNRIPVISSSDTWNHMLDFFLSRICGASPEFRQTCYQKQAWNPGYFDYSIPDQPDLALESIEARYELENAIMKAISTGNGMEAYQYYCQFLQYRIFPRVSDPVRNKKNMLFILNTLLRKAAEAGHVHPLHIDNLSRQFAIQIESCLTIEQLESLSMTMFRKYGMLVSNYSRQSYSPLVQTCLDYIDFHYNSELSLSVLSSMCSVSDSYLSSLFKKETGMTITDYINDTRVRQALILLNSSTLSIGEIASRCGFFDANYFSRIFKKLQGHSPREYRNSIRNKGTLTKL